MITDYSESYKDIIDKQRPVHDGDEFEARHPKMSIENRAKIYEKYEDHLIDSTSSINEAVELIRRSI